ncbi:MAG: SDR family NAD(P)-dependent oxidoreductase, partial [Puniceicoccales bacterium]
MSRSMGMNESVLITGVSSGLGYGLAELYLDLGWDVYGCSRRVPEDLVAKGLRHREVDLRDSVKGGDVFRRLIQGVSDWSLVYLNAGKLGEIRDMKDSPLEDLRDT